MRSNRLGQGPLARVFCLKTFERRGVRKTVCLSGHAGAMCVGSQAHAGGRVPSVGRCLAAASCGALEMISVCHRDSHCGRCRSSLNYSLAMGLRRGVSCRGSTVIRSQRARVSHLSRTASYRCVRLLCPHLTTRTRARPWEATSLRLSGAAVIV